MPRSQQSVDTDRSSSIQPGSISNITQETLQNFNHGVYKKSLAQKQQEEQEAKRKRDDEETAKVYAEFVAEFEEEPARKKPPGITLFVKGGVIQQDSETGITKTVVGNTQSELTEDRLYIMKHNFEPKPTTGSSPAAIIAGITKRLREDESSLNSGSKSAKSQKRRPYSPPPLDVGNTISEDIEESTNLFVSNLHPSVNETILLEEFGKYGPIGSVKIMWPRSEEEKKKGRNLGFVGFMTKADAALALDRMDGKYLQGNELRVGWGKAVPIPASPIYVAQQFMQATESQGEKIDEKPKEPTRLIIKVPTSLDKKDLIDRTARNVLDKGKEYERRLKLMEAKTKDYQFLFETAPSLNQYYRWRLHSLSASPKLDQWDTKEFKMDGKFWVPPPRPFTEEAVGYISVDALWDWNEDDFVQETDHLCEKARIHFENMLRRLTNEATKIASAMVFALDHTKAAAEIAEIIFRSLLVEHTTLVPTKLARLYLVNDILHNTGAPIADVKRFRVEFEKFMPEIFDHLGQIYRRTADPDKEYFRTKVLAVLNYWESRLVFAHLLLNYLKASFEKGLELASNSVSALGPIIDETERQRSREIERKVADYMKKLTEQAQTSIVDGRRMSSQEIREKCQEYRERLLKK